ncbi:MAG: hypothetical protein HRU17_17475 [Polyangiaceae bacterium]|nr:hypothetical protein [Polyangiaceae bacterium]
MGVEVWRGVSDGGAVDSGASDRALGDVEHIRYWGAGAELSGGEDVTPVLFSEPWVRMSMG